MRPKPGVKTEKLQDIFLKVFDDWFVKSENPDAERWLELRSIIAVAKAKKYVIKTTLALIWQTPENLWNDPVISEMRKDQISAINRFLDDPMQPEGDFLEELDRVLNVEIGILDNEIMFSEAEMQKIVETDTDVVYDFYKELQSIEDVHGRTLNEQMLLPMFVANKKAAIEKSRQHAARQNGKK